MFVEQKQKAIQIVKDTKGDKSFNADKLVSKINTNHHSARLIIYLDSIGLLYSHSSYLLKDVWEKVLIELEALDCTAEQVKIILRNSPPSSNQNDEQIKAAIILNIKSVITGFSNQIPKNIVGAVIRCEQLECHPIYYAGLFESPILANNIYQLTINCPDLTLLRNAFSNQQILEVLKKITCTTPEKLLAYSTIDLYQIKKIELTDNEVLIINFLSKTVEDKHSFGEEEDISKWLKNLFKSHHFANALTQLLPKITHEDLYNVLKFQAGLELFLINKIQTPEALRAYGTLFAFIPPRSNELIKLNDPQIEAINNLDAIYDGTLISCHFRECLIDILADDRSDSEKPSLMSNIKQLLLNKARPQDIASMLQHVQGLALLQKRKITTPESLLTYRFLINQSKVPPEDLSFVKAYFLMILADLNQKKPLSNLNKIIDELIAHKLPNNLWRLSEQLKLRKKDILETTLQNPLWFDFLSSEYLFTHIQEEREKTLACGILLMAGTQLRSNWLYDLPNKKQIDLVLNPQIRKLNCREIYQKIIDNPDYMAALLKDKPEQLEVAFKAIQFGQSEEDINFCRNVPPSSNLYNMLRHADTKEVVAYVIQFCQTLDQLENKLSDFRERGEHIAGQVAMVLVINLNTLATAHFGVGNWNADTVEMFKTAVIKEIRKPEYAVLGVHRGILGVAENIVGPVSKFLWGTEQKVTLFQPHSSQLIQKLTGND
ncbi:MAG: hypothetical protein K2X39_06220, partial [Silvanigrellaceae bacterium]|nr:hypothetical protein [Silvanigrellaceae bacterium]